MQSIFKLSIFCLFSIYFSSELYGQVDSNEHLSLCTDRDVYISGENIFFSLYSSQQESQKTDISIIAYIVFRNSEFSFDKKIIQLTDNHFSGTVYITDTLKTGHYQLVAYTNSMRNYQIYAVRNILVINRFDKYLNYFRSMKGNDTLLLKKIPENTSNFIEIDKDSFKVREKIKLHLKLAAMSTKHSNYAISVYEKNSLNVSSSKELQAETNREKYYPVETKGLIISGKILNKENKPVKREYIFLSTVDTIPNLLYSITDEQGRFQFLLPLFYLGKELVLKLKESKIETQDSKIIIDDKFDIPFFSTPISQTISIEDKKYIFHSQEITQIQKAYLKPKIKQTEIQYINKNYFPFVYYTPSTIIKPDDYESLENFKEISSNLLTWVKVEKVNNKYDAFIFNILLKQFFNIPALIFVDGIPIDGVNQIFTLSSDSIERIEICANQRILGKMEIPGILSINTFKQKGKTLDLALPAKRIKVSAIENATELLLPEYSLNLNKNMPDFRQTLYWNSNLKFDENGECFVDFYASDWFGEYEIRFNEIMNSGEINSFSKTIKIYK